MVLVLVVEVLEVLVVLVLVVVIVVVVVVLVVVVVGRQALIRVSQFAIPAVAGIKQGQAAVQCDCTIPQ